VTEAEYEGKAKILMTADRPEEVLVYYKDDATAGNGAKKATIEHKGALNARITERLFTLLAEAGVPTCLLGRRDERTLVCRRLDMIPIEVVLRNVLAGSLARRLGRPEGEVLPFPVVEFYLKDDPLGDPFLNEDHAVALGFATRQECDEMKALARQVNAVLTEFFARRGIRLVDFKLEFGRADGKVLLGDEISPDTCRLWDMKSGEKLDKDRFRRDLGGVGEAYQEVLNRVEG